MKRFGFIEFEEFYKGHKENVAFHLYIVDEWEGEPTESDEMSPKWFDINDIPYDKMFTDDRYWLPLVLEGRKINAFFKFDQDWNIVFKEINDL